ncbi:chitin synthase-domain-containing protein [Naematelia encephala]|uniref:chitin synthase n=1 Tax=Naematelia encephala TaxID=71784 RepID=A0A1Y2ARN0_9TREE|nr:chitin synthase-domain-containing protein [Naematelia encephala]
MARPHPTQNVSFQDSAPPSRRATRDDVPPRPPAKNYNSKNNNLEPIVSTSYEPALGYDEGYVDAGASNVQGFSSSNGADVRRKKSMVRPERERFDPGHRLFYYREHAQEDQMNVLPSSTGNQPRPVGTNLRRGKSLLARDSDDVDQGSGLNLFKRATIRRKASRANPRAAPNGTQTNRIGAVKDAPEEKVGCLGDFAPGPKDAWMVYCFLITCWIPGFVIRGVFGKRTPEAQRAWREKMGIMGIVVSFMAIVGFITFGFTQTVCGTQKLRIKAGHANSGSLVINGYDYDFSRWKHPAVSGSIFNGSNSPLYMDQWDAGGKDASFLFQNVNVHCKGIITAASGSAIPTAKDNAGLEELGWYFPCNLHDQNTTLPVNLTGYESSTNCHTSTLARQNFSAIVPTAQIYYTWDMVKDETKNLAVYKTNVLDLNLLNWLTTSQVSYPSIFDTLKTRNTTFAGQDITAYVERSGLHDYAKCLSDVIQVGSVDSISIGCVASDVVLYVSLIFILGAVGIKFVMAVVFGWFLSWRLGNFEGESYQQRMKRAAEVEAWTDDIYKAAPGYLRPNATGRGGGGQRKTVFLPTTSRFSKAEPMLVNSRPSTAYGMINDMPRRQASSMYGNKLGVGMKDTPPGSPMLRNSRSSTSLPMRDESRQSLSDQSMSSCPFPLGNVVPQPAPDFEPFQFPLVHTICLVTAYSESVEGLRTTLDSLATTDYPNSHKLILVICDGMVRGSGSKQFTPDIVLGMMKEFVDPADEVQAHSYVAIADGHKRHNMAKVYAGFYAYDPDTVEPSKQQRVPMVLVAKTGNPLERNDAKPGQRGKRDSQIVLMSFLQKVMFDERMTTFDYEFFNSLWRCTGIPPDRYETVLCVDADTKVFPDSLTRMNACMVNDTEIMGLCGETKIANKSETWVTMIQVFEYYISHHLTKAFESVFGGVTCLPGCFSMYRIKAPKGDRGYWVPILANPDICEHYSENVVDTLHKKNLLLLGEDRYLSTLMLKTFPKRKMVFCPQAVCKTIVPDTFRILLSQRRRWINSTVHNLFELMLVRDLCGTFCFSMQFVVFMDLVGTLVLPAAISFTLYIIIIAIIPSSVTGIPTPVVSLILLAFILGLPGVLIVITSRKVAYVGWMLMYLLSLPIWNLVLPSYAFWHMDDFTWGETRKVAGEQKEVAHGDKEGTFDSSHIVMKRWVDFERERRWQNGTISRDSQFYDVVQRSNSPKGAMASKRYSEVSTSETYMSNLGTQENNPLFSNPQYRTSNSLVSMSQYASGPGEKGESMSQLALPVARNAPMPIGRDPSPSSSESGFGGRLERGLSDDPSSFTHSSASYSPFQPYTSDTMDEAEQPILPPHFPQSAPEPQSYYQPARHYSAEPEPVAATQPRQRHPSHGRGVSLVDTGPVPAGGQVAPHDPVRRVSRHQRRSSSRNQLVSPVSTSSQNHSLPPGAVSFSVFFLSFLSKHYLSPTEIELTADNHRHHRSIKKLFYFSQIRDVAPCRTMDITTLLTFFLLKNVTTEWKFSVTLTYLPTYLPTYLSIYLPFCS